MRDKPLAKKPKVQLMVPIKLSRQDTVTYLEVGYRGIVNIGFNENWLVVALASGKSFILPWHVVKCLEIDNGGQGHRNEAGNKTEADKGAGEAEGEIFADTESPEVTVPSPTGGVRRPVKKDSSRRGAKRRKNVVRKKQDTQSGSGES